MQPVMDVEQLHIVLQQSFSADAAIRNPAEATIKNLKNLAGAVVLLLQVAAEKQVRYVTLRYVTLPSVRWR
jgi:hypothetical protein